MLTWMTERSPWGVILVVAILSVVLGFYASQMETASSQESFAPDTPEIQASAEIDQLFSTGATEQVIQIILSDSDVISADGLRTVAEIEQRLRSGTAADYLSDRPDRPGVVTYLDGVLQAAQAQGLPLDALTDEQVDQLYTLSLQNAPSQQADFLRKLAASDADGPNATAGLVVVFLDTSKLPADGGIAALGDLEQSIADDVTSLSDGVQVQAFSMLLLFGEESDFQREVGRLFATAFLVILLILGYVYFVRPRNGGSWLGSVRRTAADVALTLLVIMTAILWMQGIGVLMGPKYLDVIGNFSEITQIIPVLLIGMGVDYAIHLIGRYREELGKGKTVDRSVARAVGTVGVALVLATLTTAVGFLTNLISPLPGLRDFGILTAIGIAVAFLLMLTLLPAVRLLLDRRAERRGTLEHEMFETASSPRLLPRLAAKTAVLAERVPIPTLIITLVLGGLGWYGLTQLETTFSFTDFLPKDAPGVVAFQTLEERFGGGVGEQTNVLIKGDIATPESFNAMSETWKRLATVDNVEAYGAFAAAESPVSVVATLAQNRDPAIMPAVVAAGLTPDLTVSADADVAALYDAAMAAAPEQAGKVLAKEGGRYIAAQFVIQTSAGESGASQLRSDLLDAFAPVAAVGAEVVPTSTEIISAVIVDKLSASQVRSLFFTILVAMLLLIINFWVEVRRPFLGVITIAPVALVVLWTFGMMAVFGIPFNPVTATLSAIAVGIGVPFTIHVTHRFEEDRARYEDPEEAIRSTARHTGAALAGSAFTTMAGFGVLITSSLGPIRQMGQVTVFAIGFALVASVLVLPSMLALWDSWHRKRGEAVLDRSTLAEHGFIE